YTWHTSDWPDGSLYKLAVRVINPLMGMGIETTAVFTVNNPDENGVPSVVFLDVPQLLQGDATLSLLCGDPEADEYTLRILLSCDGQRSWNEINSFNLSTERETLTVTFDTRAYPNTEHAYLMAIAEAPNGCDTSIVGPFSIQNYRHLDESDSAVVHVAGSGDGEIRVYEVENPSTSDTFMITFETYPNGDITYSVYDISTGSFVFQEYPILEGLESPMFYNMALAISTIHDTICDDSLSGHIAGNSNFEIVVRRLSRIPPSTSDYLITFYSERIGQALYGTGMDTVSVNFIVEDLLTGDTVMPWFHSDIGRDTLIATSGDRILIISDLPMSWGWDVEFNCEAASPVPPAEGDTFLIKILNPFSESDTFLLFPDNLLSVEEIERPIPTQTPVLMVRSVASAKGALQFRLNLPHDADVHARLFDLSGRLVAKRDYGILTAGTHMLSLQPQTLPSGVYFLEVKAANYRMVKRLVLFR
ncbi:MAG: hypothetical protein DRQ10_08535, partial [Candidatus Hydrothermota bacterium]